MNLKQIANKIKPNANVTVTVAVVFGAFVLLLAAINRSVNIYDEGIILFGSVRVLSGDVPYRDFYANYGPGQFYALAALFKVFGPSVIVERIWDLLIRALTVGVIYQILQRTWNRKVALFASCVSVIWLSGFGYYGYPIFPCLLFSFLSIYFALPVFEGRHDSAALLMSGSCIGIVGLFRYDVGGMAAAGGALILGLFCHTQDANNSLEGNILVRSEAVYLGGIALVAGAASVMLLSAVSIRDIAQCVILSTTTYRQMRSLPFPSLIEIGRHLFSLEWSSGQLILYAPVVAAIVGVIGATQSGVRKSQRWVLAQISIFTALFYLKGVVRVSLAHMSLSLLPAVVIISVIIWQGRLRYWAANILLLAVTLCLVIASFFFVRNAALQFSENIAWARNPGSCHAAEGLERIRCFSIGQGDQAAIRYVQQRSQENEYIYVGSARHDKLYAGNTLFYFASKRLAATRWHQIDPGVQTTAAIQTEMVADLQKRKPRFVVLYSDWDWIEEPNDSRFSSGVTLLDDFIRANYLPVSSFGTITIYADAGQSLPLTSPGADALVLPSMTAEQWFNLALRCYQQRRYLESIGADQAAVRLKPDYAEAYNNIAAGYSALRLYEFAIPAAQQALRLKPDFPLARNNLNWALEQKRIGSH
jgi:tetratricopeptide (TPR) repeat protein